MVRARHILSRLWIVLVISGLWLAVSPVALAKESATVGVEAVGAADIFEFGDFSLMLPNQSHNPAVREAMAALPPERVDRANKVRRWVVKTTGALLFKLQKPIGAIASIRGRLKELRASRAGLARWFGRTNEMRDETAVRAEEAAAKADLGREKVAAIMAAVNSFFLESGAVISTSVEQGIMFSIGPQVEVGVGHLGRGGTFSIDVFVGFNRKEGTIVLALLPRVESFQSGVSASFGAAAKLEYYWMTDAASEAGGRLSGTAIYPPGTAWGSLVNELSEGRFAAIGLFGLMGADFSGGALPLTNQVRGVRALRISIPVTRGQPGHGRVEVAIKKFLATIGADIRSLFKSSRSERAEECDAVLGSDSSG